MPRGKNKAKAKTPGTSPITPYGGKPVSNQGLRETEITYKSIWAALSMPTINRGEPSQPSEEGQPVAPSVREPSFANYTVRLGKRRCTLARTGSFRLDSVEVLLSREFRGSLQLLPLLPQLPSSLIRSSRDTPKSMQRRNSGSSDLLNSHAGWVGGTKFSRRLPLSSASAPPLLRLPSPFALLN